MTARFATDVCVVGGGPAGAVVSLRLRQSGFRVILIDQARSTPKHNIETIPSTVLTTLQAAGLTEVLERISIFPIVERQRIWETEEAIVDRQPIFAVDRRSLDTALLESCIRANVQIFKDCTVTGSSVDESATQMLRVRPRGGDEFIICGKFVIDATGRASWSGKRRRMSPPSIAILAKTYSQSGPRPGTMLIEALPNSWIWGLCTPDHYLYLTLLLDPRERSGDLNADSRFMRQLRQSRLIPHSKMREFEFIGAIDASTFVTEYSSDLNQLRIGDALLTADPLSSNGLKIAIHSALHAGAAVDAMRMGKERRYYSYFWKHWDSIASRHLTDVRSAYGAAYLRHGTNFWSDRAQV